MEASFLGFQDNGSLCKTLYSRTLVYNTDQLYGDNMRNIVRALGRPILVEAPDLKITPAVEYIKASGLCHKPYMIFHPAAAAPKRSFKRSFTAQGAREVIAYVLERNPEMHVVLSGGPTERKFIEEIRNGLRIKERIITAIGCSAQEIAALIQSAEFYLGLDTGITHLACFLHARVIVVAHSGTATNWLPFYCPSATVLYRLEEESEVRQSREYLDAKRRGRIKPLGTVPIHAICAVVDRVVGCRGNEEESAQEMDFGEKRNGLGNSR
jgi:ADP-heptose:LPS heptosyltransferase